MRRSAHIRHATPACTCRPTWMSQMEQRPPAVVAYVQHLTEVSASDPVRLVAHAYTQQMALLAGGQRMRKFVTSTVPGLQGKEGVSVFCFEARLMLWTSLDTMMILVLWRWSLPWLLLQIFASVGLILKAVRTL